ncbi:hypothetical protein ILYODFUR_023448 [Ilyodon furcidens]|uniref:Uncharacterized protein n=1 Tax=Ilyodon furcidens TaxID=33524 RepID=A0ABV0TAV1_9TELE
MCPSCPHHTQKEVLGFETTCRGRCYTLSVGFLSAFICHRHTHTHTASVQPGTTVNNETKALLCDQTHITVVFSLTAAPGLCQCIRTIRTWIQHGFEEDLFSLSAAGPTEEKGEGFDNT